MGKPQRDLGLRIGVFAIWILGNLVFWNVAKDLGWVPTWLAFAFCGVCFGIGLVVQQVFLRRWRRQFQSQSTME